MKLLRTISRLLVGLVFIFSGFVKGVDPLGTAYKIEDYFIAYGMDWAMPLALFLAISLCMVEFVLGMTLVLNLRLKQLSWLLLAIMSFFTIVTFYDALYSPVPDCGCFGDAITLTNWQTFYKNVVLMIFVLFIFTSKKKFKSIFKPKVEMVLILIGVIGFSWFSIYQYRHLPMIDFREWKVGTDLTPVNEQRDEVFLIYKNSKTGETQEYLSPNYPWNDSVWMSEWEFADQRVVEHGSVQLHNLRFEDLSGGDLTDEIIHNPDYQLFVITWNVNQFPSRAVAPIKALIENVTIKGYAIQGLTSSLSDDIQQFETNTGIDLIFYNADDIVLKTMIRANPGIVLIKDGEILAKWHYNDCPDIAELERKFPGF